MASLSKVRSTWRVQFSYRRKRYTIRLGASKRIAEDVRMYVERLISATASNTPLDVGTSEWIAGASASIKQSLATAGLIEAVPCRSLLGLIEYSFKQAHVKDSTLNIWKKGVKDVLAFFDGERDISTITPGDAEEFRRWMIVDRPRHVAPSTVKQRCMLARQWFEVAVKKRWIRSNPFGELKGWAGTNMDRHVMVPAEIIHRLIDVCPNTEWKLILAFARWGGFRIPSEIDAICWGDINWERGIMNVPGPKTERKKPLYRTVPIFPEIRPYLEAAYEEAPEGATHIIRRRKTGQHLRSNLQTICKRAGVTPWPKLFQNLRSTRETELLERFPLHVVCAWIGNSPRVAQRHYLQVTQEHLDRAITGDVIWDAQTVVTAHGTSNGTHQQAVTTDQKTGQTRAYTPNWPNTASN